MKPARSPLPFVIAHRGASHACNENSGSALRLAKSLGVRAIEIDVRRLRDGGIVVMHDDDLLRSCGDPRRVSEIDSQEWRTLTQSFSPAFQREPVLTLEDAWQIASPVPLVIEIKRDDDPALGEFAQRVASFLEQHHDTRSTVISFESPAADAASDALGPTRAGLIRNTEYGESGFADLLDSRCGIAVLSRRIVTPERISKLLAAGKSVYVYALDDAASVHEHVAWGVTGIISNRPDVALQALATNE